MCLCCSWKYLYPLYRRFLLILPSPNHQPLNGNFSFASYVKSAFKFKWPSYLHSVLMRKKNYSRELKLHVIIYIMVPIKGLRALGLQAPKKLGFRALGPPKISALGSVENILGAPCSAAKGSKQQNDGALPWEKFTQSWALATPLWEPDSVIQQ